MQKSEYEQEVWKILKSYFKYNSPVSNQIESYNNFVHFGMQDIVDQEASLNIPGYSLKFGQICLGEPQIIEEDRSVHDCYPMDARLKDINYDAPILLNFDEIYKDGEKTDTKSHYKIMIGRMPIMLKSSVCNLSKLNFEEKIQKGECPNDLGGYFIIKGKERVIVPQVRGNYNHVFVLKQKPNEKFKYIAEVRSMSNETGHSVLIQALFGNDDRSILFSLPHVKEQIPVGVVFKAMGFVTEEEIQNLIGVDDALLNPFLKFIIRDSFFCTTQQEALKYIGERAMHILENDEEEDYAWQVVENESLPHLGISGSIKEQALFMGNIVKKLLQTVVGYRTEDDRDNYANKRIETTGTLIHDIFRNLFKKFIKSLEKMLKDRKQKPDILSIIARNRTSITKGLHQCMATGNWGIQKTGAYIRHGVSQVLDRMTFYSSLSHLRRVIIPVGKESKNSAMRQMHSSSFGMLCPCECFHPDTKILTWSGEIKKAKDIIVGDILIDDQGNPTKVKSTCSGLKEMYTIKHVKNMFEDYTVTDNHILTLKPILHGSLSFHRKRKYYQVLNFNETTLKYEYKTFLLEKDAINYKNTLEDKIVDISIEKYLKLSKYITQSLKAFKVPIVNWPYKEVDLDPYILGMWLGDGMSQGYGFASNDEELIQKWQEWAIAKNARIEKRAKYLYGVKSTTLNPLHSVLKKYNLIDNKHIPKEYLFNDKEIRLKVLAGLIDTDGHVRSKGREIRITQCLKRSKLIFDALMLARSLGFCCHINTGKNSWTHKGIKKNGEYLELTITGNNIHEIPTILQRKKILPPTYNPKRVNSLLQTSFTLEKQPLQPFVGWQLEGNGRFLLGDFTVTHNTPEGAGVGIVLNLALSCKITRRIPVVIVKKVLEKLDCIVPVNDFDISNTYLHTPIFLNGAIIGYCEDYSHTLQELKKLKSQGLLDSEISITYDVVDNDIRMYCDDGRVSRPLLTLTDNSLNLTKQEKYNWKSLLKNGIVEYLDSSEIENVVIAMNMDRLKIQTNDYMEIHPILMLGIMASRIPFPDHSQSPRNCYQCLWEEEDVYMGDGSLKKIKDIKPGDKVITVDPETCEQSVTTVIAQYVKETTKPIVKVILESGKEVVCTNDHPILTSLRWKKAGSLTSLDKVCVCDTITKKSIFVPVKEVKNMPNVKIADITVNSKTHSFITGQGICVHNSSMGKQALGYPLLSYNIRADTTLHVLQYAQKPLVYTKIDQLLKSEEMPCGMNAMVAILAYTGYNQEDSCILNRSSVERGMFCLTSYYTIDTIEKKKDSNTMEEICMPPESTPHLKEGDPGYFLRKKEVNYSLLDENGIVRPRQYYDPKKKIFYGPETVVKKGDVIVGKKLVTKNKNGQETIMDVSVVVQPDQEGIVDKVYVNITPSGTKLVKIVIREWRVPGLGDKFAARSSQKATVGMVFREEDLPFTQEGIRPDIIINPCCIPGRMTINQLIECILGKKCCKEGTYGDATPFTTNSEDIAKRLVGELSKYGFESHGWETMINGMTGEMMNAQIFMGPTFYQRLKHMVDDKMHARAKGQVTILVRQPTEGRSKEGGLRFGEMEKDGTNGHGTASFLLDRLFYNSDPFKIPLCRKCGIMTNTTNECQKCKGDKVVMTNIPYASKLLTTELTALNLGIQIFPQDK